MSTRISRESTGAINEASGSGYHHQPTYREPEEHNTKHCTVAVVCFGNTMEARTHINLCNHGGGGGIEDRGTASSVVMPCTNEITSIAAPSSSKRKATGSSSLRHTSSSIYGKRSKLTDSCPSVQRCVSGVSSSSPTDVREVSQRDGVDSSHVEKPPTQHQSTANDERNSGKQAVEIAGNLKMVPATLRGIVESARVLHASCRQQQQQHAPSSISCGGGNDAPSSTLHQSSAVTATPSTILAFPTETVYTMGCCVKVSSAKSIGRRLHLDYKNSGEVCGRSGSSCEQLDNQARLSKMAKDLSAPNPSLESLLQYNSSNDNVQTDPFTTNNNTATPSLFVCDMYHAQHYCEFSKFKTFGIRPSSSSFSAGVVGVSSSLPLKRAASSSASAGLMENAPKRVSCQSLMSADQHQSQQEQHQQEHQPHEPLQEQFVPSGVSTPFRSISREGSTTSSTGLSLSSSDGGSCSVASSSESSTKRSSTSSLPTASASTNINAMEAASAMLVSTANELAAALTAPSTPPHPQPFTLPALYTTESSRPTNDQTPIIKNTSSTKAVTTAAASTNNNTSKMIHAASFSESREAFLRLASKFWPGPLVLYMPVKMVRGEDVAVASIAVVAAMSAKRGSPNGSGVDAATNGDVGESRKNGGSVSSSSSCGSLVNLSKTLATAATSIQDNISPMPSVPILPTSVLTSAAELLSTNDTAASEETFYIGMQCPSHPLSRKILNEVYHGPTPSSSSTVGAENVPVTNSNNSSGVNKTFQRRVSSPSKRFPRCSIAVVGCSAPGTSNAKQPTTISNTFDPSYSTSASQVASVVSSKSTSATNDGNSKQGNDQVFILDGEDTRESFSVPTCQYGMPHPVSLVIDGENRTIHLVRRRKSEFTGEAGAAKEGNGKAPANNYHTFESSSSFLCKHASITEDIIHRTLLQPPPPAADPSRKNEAGSTSGSGVNRVISAVLSRWKIEERMV